jgi:DNA-binding transcriptional regulator YiaG
VRKKTRRTRGPSLATLLQSDFNRLAARASDAINRRVTRLQRQTRALRRKSLDQRRGLARLERGVARLRDLESGASRRAADGPRVTPAEVRALRSRMGMTRERFARHLGVSPGSIFLWETGRATPRAASAARIHAQARGGPVLTPKRRRVARAR